MQQTPVKLTRHHLSGGMRGHTNASVRRSLAPLDQICDLGIVLVLRSISGP
jgi:hypothetical protein